MIRASRNIKFLTYQNYKLFDRYNDMYKSGLNHIKIKKYNTDVCLFLARQPPSPSETGPPHFLDHTQRRTTLGRAPLDEWSARRRDLYLTTHNTHNKQTSMPPDGIRTHNLSRRAVADLRFIPRGHWDRHNTDVIKCKYKCYEIKNDGCGAYQ